MALGEIPSDEQLQATQKQVFSEMWFLRQYCEDMKFTELPKALLYAAICLLIGAMSIATKPGRCGEWMNMKMSHIVERIFGGLALRPGSMPCTRAAVLTSRNRCL